MEEMDIFERLRRGMPVEKRDPDFADFLVAVRKAEALRAEYNTTGPDYDRRRELLEKILHAEVKGGTGVIPPFHFDLGFNIHLGKDDIVNYDVVMLDDAEINIGDNVFIGPGAKLVTANHPTDPETRRTNPFITYASPINVGNNVWIGAGAIILPGITIGDNAIVGAGAVVTHDVPAGATVVGNPARPIIRR